MDSSAFNYGYPGQGRLIVAAMIGSRLLGSRLLGGGIVGLIWWAAS